MSIPTYRKSFKYAFLSVMMLLLSTSATATTIPANIFSGNANVLDHEVSKAPPKQCLRLPHTLDSTQLNYDDFIQLVGGPKGSQSSSFQPQPIALTTSSQTLCFNELKYGYRYHVTFREGFPLENGNTYKQKTRSVFDITDLAPNIKFQTNSLILPTIGGPKVPLKLTNTDEFSLQIFRLSETEIQRNQGLKSLSLLDKRQINRVMDSSHLIVEQSFSVKVPKNKPTTFNLDLTELIDAKKPGVYVLVAESKDIATDYWTDRATQYVMFTDIGLSSYQGIDGLRVYARSYTSAEPLVETQIELIARNEEVLQTLTTNAQGYVQFSLPMMNGQGGLKPVQIRARNKHGLVSYLNLLGKELDLSDRPISGADPLGLFNAYLFTERGVYRPGEDVVLSGLVRNKNLVAPIDVPLTLKIFNAQGKEQFSRLIGYLEQGGLQHRFTVPSSSKTGQWLANLYLNTKEKPIGSVNFSVEDYVPETLEVKLDTAQPGYTDEAMEVTLQSDYLYGAPATELAVTATINFSPKRRLFSEKSEYVFGHYGDKTTKKQIKVNDTDDKGSALIILPKGLLKAVNSNQAHVVNITAGVTEPSGREVRSRLQFPVLNYASWVGVRV